MNERNAGPLRQIGKALQQLFDYIAREPLPKELRTLADKLRHDELQPPRNDQALRGMFRPRGSSDTAKSPASPSHSKR